MLLPLVAVGALVAALQAAPADVVLAGRAVDDLTGLPLPEVRVVLFGYPDIRGTWEFAEPDGSFRVAGRRPDAFWVYVDSPGYAMWSSGERHWEAGEHRLDVRLVRECRFDLRVTRRDGSLPDALLQVELLDRIGEHVGLRVDREVDGSFLWKRVPADVLRLVLKGPDLDEALYVNLDLRGQAPDGLPQVRVVLPGAPRVRADLHVHAVDAAHAQGVDRADLPEELRRGWRDAGTLLPLDGPLDVEFLDASGVGLGHGRLARFGETWALFHLHGAPFTGWTRAAAPRIDGWAPRGSTHVRLSAPGHRPVRAPLTAAPTRRHVALVREE